MAIKSHTYRGIFRSYTAGLSSLPAGKWRGQGKSRVWVVTHAPGFTPRSIDVRPRAVQSARVLGQGNGHGQGNTRSARLYYSACCSARDLARGEHEAHPSPGLAGVLSRDD